MINPLVPLALCAALFASAPAAHAATTVAFGGGVLTITGDEGDNVVFESSFDDPFETDFDPGQPIFVAGSGGTLAAGPGCNQSSPTTVDCPGMAGATRADISLGAGNDSFIWTSARVPLTIDGGPGNDELLGGDGDDKIDGGTGNDSLFGGNGRDRLTGGPGRDSLNGDGSGTATHKPARDTILAKDGELDNIDCADGVDEITADRSDKIATVCRTGVPSGSTATGGKIKLTVVPGSLPSLRRFSRGAPVRFKVTATARCRMASTLTITRTERRRLRYRGPLVLADSFRILQPGRRVTVLLKGRRPLRRAVASRSSAKLGVRVACSSTGQPAVVKLRLTLKR